MLLVCIVDTPIHINRSYLFALRVRVQCGLGLRHLAIDFSSHKWAATGGVLTKTIAISMRVTFWNLWGPQTWQNKLNLEFKHITRPAFSEPLTNPFAFFGHSGQILES